MGNRSDAEDLVQRAFEIALAKPIDNPRSLRGFIFRTLHYASLTHHRSRLRETFRKENFKNLITDLTSPDTTLEAYAVFEDLENAFGKLLANIFQL